jgi:hypothetical protein
VSRFENPVTMLAENGYPYVTLRDYEALLKSQQELIAAAAEVLDYERPYSTYYATKVRWDNLETALRNARGEEGGK